MDSAAFGDGRNSSQQTSEDHVRDNHEVRCRLHLRFISPVPLLDYVRSSHPKALFVGYGETDNWAHSGRYDLVLESCRQFDHFVEQLWTTMQAMPEYKDNTTFLITTDHGRGHGLIQWKEHGVDQKGSENIWFGVIGPDTPALGERSPTVGYCRY